MRWWLIGGAVVAVLAVAGVVSVSLSSGQSVEAARVVRGEMRQYVDERGMTRLPQDKTYLITMPFEGRLSGIHVVAGQPVQEGEVLAQVDQRDLEYAVAEAQAVVDRLEAAIRKNNDTRVEDTLHQQAGEFVTSMEATVQAAKSRMDAGKARLEYAQWYLARTKESAQEGAVTEDEVQRAEVARVEAQVDFQQDELVYQAMRAIEAATRLLPKVVTQYTERKDLEEAVLLKQKAEATAQLSQVKLRQQRGTIESPADGEVLERMVDFRRDMPAGTVLFRIGSRENLEVEADILSQDVVDIRPGQPVDIYGPAVGRSEGEGIPGVVERINPAGFTKINSLGVEQQRVRVIVRFRNREDVDRLVTSRGLGVGYRVRVRVFTATEEDALTVPRSALFRGPDDGWQLFAVRKGRAGRTPVEVGLMNDQRAQIVKGLEEEDTVILAPETSLEDGAPVRVTLLEP